MAFLHGVEVVELTTGPRPIKTLVSSVIGLVGTAPDADAAAFPLDTPVLIAGNQAEAAKLDPNFAGNGTLYRAVTDIFEQTGASVVVVRVDVGVDDAATQSNVIGDGPSGTGMQALIGAKSALGVEPRILIAPEFSDVAAVGAALEILGDKLRAATIIDGPNTDDATALTAIGAYSSARVYMVDPWVKVWDTITDAEVTRPASARVAGVMVKSDTERGFWWSPSNNAIKGVLGTGRPVDFKLGDASSRANYLNENKIATIINESGYRLWGNRSATADPVWQFLSVRRTADLIQDSLQRAHLWAVDRNITTTYLEDVVEGVNAYLRELIGLGAILGGKCWADPDLNTPAALQAGKVYIDFDFTPPAPAEHIAFRSRLVNDYFEEVVS